MNDTTTIGDDRILHEQAKIEWKKCLESPEYFILKYCNIKHPKKGTIPFNLYSYQRTLLKEFTSRRFLMILKARQLGITTLISSYCLWFLLFHNDKSILFISIKQSVSKDIISKITFSLDKLPSFLKCNTVERNRLSLSFSNGSSIETASSSGDTGRSKALSLLIVDEAAHIEEMEEIWTSAYNTLSTGGEAIVLSTPKGVGNWFHRMWTASEMGENDFYCIKYRWSVHPERTELWRQEQTKNLGELLANQECEAEFLSSGANVIGLDILQKYEKDYVCEPITKNIGNGLWTWEKEEPNRRYCLFCDAASGTGPDFSVAHVFDIDNCVQVAEYKGKIQTKDFGKLLVELAKQYNDALIIIEREAYADSVVQELKDLKYPNIFHSESEMRIVEGEEKDNKNKEPKLIPGVRVTSATRPRVIETLIQYFTDGSVIIRSKRLLSELQTFIWKNNKAQAASGFNDDLVMALGVGLWTRDAAICRTTKRVEQYQPTQMYSNLPKSSSVIMNPPPVGAHTAWTMNLGKEQESLMWLLR